MNPIELLSRFWEWLKNHPIFSKTAGTLTATIIVAVWIYFFPGGVATVFGWFEPLLRKDTWTASFPLPVWVAVLILAALLLVCLQMARASEAHAQEAIDLGNELREVLDEQSMERMEGQPPIEAVVIHGIRWKCTHAANGTVNSLRAFCPDCDDELEAHRRFQLHGSPVAYSCIHCNKVLTKFDSAQSLVERRVIREIERMERQEHARFRTLVQEKVAAGLDANMARDVAIRQIVNDRQQPTADEAVTVRPA